jgi:hypothetical protein
MARTSQTTSRAGGGGSAIGWRGQGAALADIETGPAPRLQIAQRHQSLIRFDHGKAGHAVPVGAPPDRRQTTTGAQQALIDTVAQPADQTLDQGRRRFTSQRRPRNQRL